MAWAQKANLTGPPGPAPDTSAFVQRSDVSGGVEGGTIPRRSAEGYLAVPNHNPSTLTDVPPAGWVSSNFTIGRYTITTSTSAPASNTAGHIITLVTE